MGEVKFTFLAASSLSSFLPFISSYDIKATAEAPTAKAVVVVEWRPCRLLVLKVLEIGGVEERDGEEVDSFLMGCRALHLEHVDKMALLPRAASMAAELMNSSSGGGAEAMPGSSRSSRGRVE